MKNLVQPEGAEDYESWTGYAQWNAEIFDNFYLAGEPVKKLSMNVQVEIPEDLGTCYLVKAEDEFGFMVISQISNGPLPFRTMEEAPIAVAAVVEEKWNGRILFFKMI